MREDGTKVASNLFQSVVGEMTFVVMQNSNLL